MAGAVRFSLKKKKFEAWGALLFKGYKYADYICPEPKIIIVIKTLFVSEEPPEKKQNDKDINMRKKSRYSIMA